MNVETVRALVPVTPVVPSMSGGEGESAARFSYQGARSGVVYVGREQNRFRGIYAPSGKTALDPPGLGTIIDLYV